MMGYNRGQYDLNAILMPSDPKKLGQVLPVYSISILAYISSPVLLGGKINHFDSNISDGNATQRASWLKKAMGAGN